jgi:putative alpha-1,2-mannosidase
LEFIDRHYIAHSWIDAHFEGGLKTGLRKYPDDPDDPSGRKPAWYVFSSLGTDREDGACEFAKKIIGINEWKEIYNR